MRDGNRRSPGQSNKRPEKPYRLFGPSVARDGNAVQFGWIENDMSYLLSIPGIGDVDHAIFGLDHGWIGKLTLFRSLKRFASEPIHAILADGNIQHFTSLGRTRIALGVIVDQEVSSIFQRYRIDTAIGIGKRSWLERTPMLATIGRPRFKNARASPITSAKRLQLAVWMTQNRWLNTTFVVRSGQQFGSIPLLKGWFTQFKVDAPWTSKLGRGWT